MNKAMIEEDFKLEKNVPNTAADIDQGNYKVFLSNLDIDRTLRMYKSLLKLSVSSNKSSMACFKSPLMMDC